MQKQHITTITAALYDEPGFNESSGEYVGDVNYRGLSVHVSCVDNQGERTETEFLFWADMPEKPLTAEEQWNTHPTADELADSFIKDFQAVQAFHEELDKIDPNAWHGASSTLNWYPIHAGIEDLLEFDYD